MEKRLRFALNTFFWWAIITMYIWAARDFGSIPAYISLALRLVLQATSFTLIFCKDRNVKRGFSYKLVIVWMVYTTIITLMNPHAPRELSENLWWPCIFILFYHIAAYPRIIHRFLDKQLTKLFVWAFFFFPFTYMAFSYSEQHATNYVFFISLLFPFLFFLKEEKRYIFFAIGLIISVLAFKRSGMLVATSAGGLIVWHDFLKAKGRNSGTKKVLSIFFVLAMAGLFVAIDNYTGGHMSGRFSSIEEDGGSGRDTIFEFIIYKFSNLNPFEQTFGLGFNGVMNHQWYELKQGVFISAHNDFLEVICDFGYIGSAMYLVLIINVIVNTRRASNYSNQLYKANVMSIVIFIIISMVSHLFIYPTYFAYLIILWSITSHYTVNKNIQRIL